MSNGAGRGRLGPPDFSEDVVNLREALDDFVRLLDDFARIGPRCLGTSSALEQIPFVEWHEFRAQMLKRKRLSICADTLLWRSSGRPSVDQPVPWVSDAAENDAAAANVASAGFLD